MSDVLTSYENGLQLLLQKLGKDTPYYNDALAYQARLWENIEGTRRYGDTELRRAERYQIIQLLNDLANNTLGISFHMLSKATIQDIDTSGRRHREFCQMDWGEAPYTEQFYGRELERAILERWLVDEHCKMIAVVGIGGIGKTSLAAKLMEQIKNEFEYIFWRSLQNAPTLENILEKSILFLSNQQRIDLPKDEDDQISLLVEYLREQRCLLVLDNFEAVLQGGSNAGTYRGGYEGYSRLIERIGVTNHQSCLLLTSRERPKEVAHAEGKMSPIRSLQIFGLGQSEGREILKDKELFGPDEAWTALILHYLGNPLALKLVAEPVRDIFGGNISEFLKKGTTVVGDIYELLDRQFKHLSELEQKIMYWLAIEREEVSPDTLQDDLIPWISTRALLGALESLRRRFMIETSASSLFYLQPVIMEYVTDRFVELVAEEIDTETIGLFLSHAFIKAHAKDHVRSSQVSLILMSIVGQLLPTLGKEDIEKKLKSILSTLHKTYPHQPTYAAGNVLNLLIQMKSDLRAYDFSDLQVRQAYLQGVSLPDVNFAHADLATCVLTEAFGSILSVTFNPNGEVIAAGTSNNEIRLWQATSDISLFTCQGHTDWIYSVAFSPDGTILASGSDDQTIRLWDASAGQLLKILHKHKGRVKSVAFSPDGTILASGSEDQTIRLWDVHAGQLLKTLRGHSGWVKSVAFSPDGTILASGSDDQTVRLWDASTGQLLKALQGHSGGVYSVAVSPDGTILASGSGDQTIRLWDVHAGQLLKTLQGHKGWVYSVAFSPDGTILASGSGDQTVRLWDANAGQLLKTFRGHSSWIWSVTISPDGTILASGSDDQTIRLWDVHAGQLLKTFRGYSSVVRCVAFSPDGTILASGEDDQAVRLWDASTGQLLKALQGHSGWVRSIAFSPDGAILASGSGDQTIRLWDASTGQLLKILHKHISPIRSIAFSPDGTILASGSEDRTIRLWDVSTGQHLKALRGHSGRVRCVAFSPDSTILASGSEEQTVQLWDASTGQLLKTLQGHKGWVYSVAFSPDGTILASGSDDQTVRLWDASAGQLLKTLQGHKGWVRSIAFSPDGAILASGSGDQTIRLWDASTGQLLKILQGHNGVVWSVVFSPDGAILASGSGDGTVKLWRAGIGECLNTMRSNRPYERMSITGVTGLTQAQKKSLKTLGAIEDQN